VREGRGEDGRKINQDGRGRDFEFGEVIRAGEAHRDRGKREKRKRESSGKHEKI